MVYIFSEYPLVCVACPYCSFAVAVDGQTAGKQRSAVWRLLQFVGQTDGTIDRVKGLVQRVEV